MTRLDYAIHHFCSKCGLKGGIGIYPKHMIFCPIHRTPLRTRPKNNVQRQKRRKGLYAESRQEPRFSKVIAVINEVEEKERH